jgi:benzoylformate decarboxylase
MAGDGAAQSHAHAELVALAELLGAPVYCEFIANTASFPSTHPLFRGAVTRLVPNVRQILDQHDVLLSVGADLFTLSLPSPMEPIPDGLSIIHIDSDPWELGKNYPTKVGLLADPKASLPELTAATQERMSSGARAKARERFDANKRAAAAEREALVAKAKMLAGEVPIQPLPLLHAIGQILPRDAVVIEEVLSSAPGIRQMITSDDPQSYFGLRGGGIGWGIPASIGIKVALPNRPVVALIGDGSAMYTIQALWTAAHQKLDIVFVIFNNSSYRILKQRVHAMRGHAAQQDLYVGMELNDPPVDFVTLSKSLGVAGERARTIAEATDLIKKAIASGGAHLIDVTLDRAFKPV